jgi:hypothetical protein
MNLDRLPDSVRKIEQWLVEEARNSLRCPPLQIGEGPLLESQRRRRDLTQAFQEPL